MKNVEVGQDIVKSVRNLTVDFAILKIMLMGIKM